MQFLQLVPWVISALVSWDIERVGLLQVLATLLALEELTATFLLIWHLFHAKRMENLHARSCVTEEVKELEGHNSLVNMNSLFLFLFEA